MRKSKELKNVNLFALRLFSTPSNELITNVSGGRRYETTINDFFFTHFIDENGPSSRLIISGETYVDRFAELKETIPLIGAIDEFTPKNRES